MENSPLDKQTARTQYQQQRPRYERLANGLKDALHRLLREEGIDVLEIQARVKDFDSFWNKVERNGYTNPFQEVTDICGLRAICYHKSDLPRISQIVHREFDVIESVDQADLLEPGEFGYLSLHCVVTVRDQWLATPHYRGLGGLKAEVQVRTILMHAWAAISHKLVYKKQQHVPDHFQRELSRLSALFEIADERFDALRQQKQAYGAGVAAEAQESGQFDVDQEMNVDSLQALLDFKFPHRIRNPEDTAGLLDELLQFNITFADLAAHFQTVEDALPAFEMELFEGVEDITRPGGGWTQTGVIRAILDLLSDDYFRSREAGYPDDELGLWTRWRQRLSEQSR